MKRIYIIFLFAFIFSASFVFSLQPELLWNKQGEESGTNSYIFSLDGKYIYTQYSQRNAGNVSFFLQKWDIDAKKIESEIPIYIPCNKMVLSNDGNSIIGASSFSKHIQITDINSGVSGIIADVRANDLLPVNSLAFSEDGKKIYVFHNSVKSLQIFDANTLLKVDSMKLNDLTYQVKFSSDGKYAGFVNGDSTLSIVNMNDKTELYNIKNQFRNYSVCNIFINSDYLILNYIKRWNPDNIEVYSMKTGKMITKAKSIFELPSSILLNDNKTILTSTLPFGNIEKFDIATNDSTNIDLNVNGYQMIGSPVGKLIAGNDSLNKLIVFDISTEKSVFTINTITNNFKRASKILISPDNKSVYVAGIKSSDTLKKGQIFEYEFSTGVLKGVIPVSDFLLTDMKLSKDGTLMTVADSVGKIFIISDLDKTPIIQKTYDLKKTISSIAVSDDKTKLIVSGYMIGFYYINLITDSIHYDFKDPYTILELDPNIYTIALTKKGDKLILSGKKKNIFVFKYNSSIDKYEKIKSFYGDESENPANEGVLNIGFSDDEKYIFSSASDGYAHIFDSGTYKEVSKFIPNPDSLQYFPSSAALTKDNSKIVVGDIYPGLSIFDVKTGEKLWSHKLEELKTFRINSIALSDDNLYMAYCTIDGSLGIYKIDGGTFVNESSNNSGINIYPNPASDYIEITSINPTLKRGVDEGSEIQIFDMLGINVSPAGGRIKEGGRIDISNLSTGIYFIKIGNRVEKFVKM
jgi:WD40 repeat protein